ncbi:hypothetical protein ACLOJK_026688, partial [Asimina triloba]
STDSGHHLQPLHRPIMEALVLFLDSGDRFVFLEFDEQHQPTATSEHGVSSIPFKISIQQSQIGQPVDRAAIFSGGHFVFNRSNDDDFIFRSGEQRTAADLHPAIKVSNEQLRSSEIGDDIFLSASDQHELGFIIGVQTKLHQQQRFGSCDPFFSSSMMNSSKSKLIENPFRRRQYNNSHDGVKNGSTKSEPNSGSPVLNGTNGEMTSYFFNWQQQPIGQHSPVSHGNQSATVAA